MTVRRAAGLKKRRRCVICSAKKWVFRRNRNFGNATGGVIEMFLYVILAYIITRMVSTIVGDIESTDKGSRAAVFVCATITIILAIWIILFGGSIEAHGIIKIFVK